MLADNELLRLYSRDGSERAFAELVRRHAGLVYGSAFRQLNGNADLARDVAQTVFTDLALKARSLGNHRSLVGWLYLSARFAAAKLIRSEQRRAAREQEAIEMDKLHCETHSADVPGRLRPLIEDAMQELESADREAVLLRYFEGHDFKSVGMALGISDEAARKRVIRAVERLRGILKQRGILSSEEALTAALSGTVALVIPAELHACIMGAARVASLPSVPKVAPSLFQMTPIKSALLLTVVVAGLGTAALFQHHAISRLRTENERLQVEATQTGTAQPAAQQTALSDELSRLRKEHSELLRLRDEVTRLRAAQREQASQWADPSRGDDPGLRGQQVVVEAKFAELSTTALKKLALEAIGIDINGVGTTAILTDAQLRALLRALEQQAGADLLSMPRVTTLHNRAASIEVGPSDGPTAGGAKLGPSVELLPVVSADRLTVSLQATARLNELVPGTGDPGGQKQELRQTAVTGSGVVYDGESLVLCQRLGQSGANGPTPLADSTNLVVLLTPTLIDPAGNRLYPTKGEVDTEPQQTQSVQLGSRVVQGRFFPSRPEQ